MKTFLLIVQIITNITNIKADCAPKNLYHVMNKFKRDFTILDLLENNGTFYYEIVKKNNYNFSYAILQKNPALKNSADLKNLIVLNKKPKQKILKKLSECEDFDIILAKASFKKTEISTLLTLGKTIVFIDKSLTLVDYQSRILPKMLTKGWLGGARKQYIITSNFREKYFDKHYGGKTIWNKGINLWNFLKLNGVYPTKEIIESEIYKNYDPKHSDFLPWNIIIQGTKIKIIDLPPPHKKFYKPNRRLRETIYLLFNPSKCFYTSKFHTKIPNKDLPPINKKYAHILKEKNINII